MSATQGTVAAGIRELTEIIGVFDSRHRVLLRGVLSRTPSVLQIDARRLTSNRVLRQSTGLHDNYFDTLSEADVYCSNYSFYTHNFGFGTFGGSYAFETFLEYTQNGRDGETLKLHTVIFRDEILRNINNRPWRAAHPDYRKCFDGRHPPVLCGTVERPDRSSDISRVRQHAVLLLNARVRVRFENEVTVIVNDMKGPPRLTRHENIVRKKEINKQQ
ncbi:hypothetical protein ALC56_02277 [Trachymyrmex septentrionalis]|uniref:Uncharacterized protein n=1 Tax=Trachymyrmex septentrionalis TaxID=34720 RepID=A0A195FTW3_9HYME|nr:hypothetical protein ALC56_02277 [Trachymyrmex septentrionalis]